MTRIILPVNMNFGAWTVSLRKSKQPGILRTCLHTRQRLHWVRCKMQKLSALETVLNYFSLHPIVRHEAAEALGAIGLENNVTLLKNSLASDPAQKVRETCELALSRINELKNASISKASPFLSVDPAAPASCSSEPWGEEVISAIIESLGAESALLRHEVAYVLGQLQNKKASDVLSQVLKDVNQHPMVRHEAVEALGSIADVECVALLEEFAMDPEPIVSQSCEIALSMLEFERSGKSFEYLFMQTPQGQQASH